MFNKEARVMQSYIRKTGYNTVTTSHSKNASCERTSHHLTYSCKLDLGKVTKLVCKDLYQYQSWSGGEFGGMDEYNYLTLKLRKNGVEVWSYFCKSGRTYTPNVEADEFYCPGFSPSGSWDSTGYALNVDITYETSVTTPYTYVVKY